MPCWDAYSLLTIIWTYRPHLVKPLPREHRRQRLQWCRERQMWNQELDRMVFRDEFRITLGMQDGPAPVRKRRGERLNSQFQTGV